MKHGDPAGTEYGLRANAALAGTDWDLMDRLGGGTMELRISVRSLVHQLVHEQAKASVHLEGLQRDVSTLLDFRDSMMTRSLGPDCPTSPRPAAQTVGPSTVPSTPTELASGGASSGLGTSAGTSTASAGTTVTATQGGAEMARSADADELMSLLETIEAQGRRLVEQTWRSDAPDTPQGAERGGGMGTNSAQSAASGATPRCVNCDRMDGHGRGMSSNPGGGSVFGARRRTTERRRPCDVRGMTSGGPEAGLADWAPGWDRSPLLGDPPLLSLPDLRPGQERLAALSLSERLLQERDALLSQLTGLEQVAVRSQLHAASLQTRLHRVLAVNDALDRELRLAGGQGLLAGSPAPVHTAPTHTTPSVTPAEDRMARSTPDLRPPSRIPQPVSLRRPGLVRERSARPRSPPSGQVRSLQPDRRPRSRSRETQTSRVETPDRVSRLVDRSINAVESTTPLVDSTTSIDICTTSVGTCTSLTAGGEAAAAVAPSSPLRPGGQLSTPRGIRPPDRDRVTAILNETSPLKLQRELLTLLVEAESLRAQVDSLGRRWSARAPPARGQPTDQQDQQISVQNDSDDIRLQLEMRNIELEGTRARLRQLEAAWASRPAPDCGSARAGGDSPSRLSPTPAPQAGANTTVEFIVNTEATSGGNRAANHGATATQNSSPARPSPISSQASGAVRPRPRPLPPTNRPPSPAPNSRGEGTAPARAGVGRPRTPTRPSSRAGLTTSGSSSSLRSGGPISGSSVGSSRTVVSASGGKTSNSAASTQGRRVNGGAGNGTASPSGRSGSPSVRSGSPGVRSTTPGIRSGSPSVGSGSTPRPVPVAGRRVADLVRGWTEAVEPRGSQERPASAGASRQTTTGKAATVGSSGARSPANGGSKSPASGGSNRAKSPAGLGSNAPLTAATAEQPEQRDKVRRRLSSETSAKIPATQSQALGQILTALSRGHSPRAPLRRATTSSTNPATTTAEPGAEVRAEVRRLRELAAQRLRQARLETSDGEVADSLTSATASEDGDASLEERLKLLEDGAGGRHGQPLVLTAGEGLLQRILGGRGGQRLKPRPAGE